MATVGITKELRDRTKNVIEMMRRAERASDLPEIDKNVNVDASYLFNMGCWGEKYVHLVNQIPKDWLSKISDANIHITGTLDDGRNLNTNVRFNNMKSAYARPKDNYYAKSDSELTIEYVLSLPEETAGRAELLKRWEDSIIAMGIDARWGKNKTHIYEFHQKCKSLNEAVKLFPTARMYIHHEDLERLDRKVERPSQRKAIVLDVDTDGLTAAAIAAKLMAAA
jgi:hypothetical protein